MRRTLPVLLVTLLIATPAAGGATGDHAVLLVDPTDAESLYLANVYRDARAVPACNVLTMTPWTNGVYTDLADRNVQAYVDTVVARGIDDHVDYVLLMPTEKYRVWARGLITDSCSVLEHLSIASAYTTAYMKDEILAGNLLVWETNRYYAAGESVVPFDGSRTWLNGSPSEQAQARRYVIGCLLGYTGDNGNTLEELLSLISRSVAADGTRPSGTFYFMETTDDARSGPRDWTYPGVVTSLQAIGASAEHLLDILPVGNHDCLGIMTGHAAPKVLTAEMTILPGAFCDHLTSYAGTFGAASQTRMSAWIARGASGSAGAVEEPCNYAGKFPHAKLHLFYAQGMTLGESYFRSATYVPFQILLYGDPLTRPFAHIPSVSTSGVPGGAASGTITLTPSATTTHPTASIAGYDLHVDGVLAQSIGAGEAFDLDTTTLNDGHHDVRVLARDDSSVATIGRWIGSITTDNRGHAATISSSASSGDLGTAFSLTVGASGGTVTGIRVLHNGRVVAASDTAPATLTVHGHLLGAGPAAVQAEARFSGGRRALSAPLTLDIAYENGGAGGATPVAYGHTKVLAVGATHVVELPSTHADDPSEATFEVVSAPAGATVLAGTDAGFRLVRVPVEAEGTDTLSFRVTTPSGTSSVATVDLVYGEETVAPDPEPEPGVIDLVVTRGDIKDKETEGRDVIKVKGTFALDPESADGVFDPAVDAVTVTIGGPTGPWTVTIPAGDPGWSENGGMYKYRSPDDARPKVRLKVKTLEGKFKLKVKKLDLETAPANPITVSLVAGGDRGAHEAAWAMPKPGRFKLR
jgi:uncharacterized protein (TIGR03790 family)